MTQSDLVPNSGKGVIRYALSDKKFIDNGWTQLPIDKVLKKINIYRMIPVEPSNWFARNKHKCQVLYNTGETLAVIEEDGSGGRWFYKNGNVALVYKKTSGPGEDESHYRIVVYSRGDLDPLGRGYEITILASFDDEGNGIVLDHIGRTRLKYNQSEGVSLDRTLGPKTHWLWHSLNESPELQQVMIDTELLVKDPEIAELGPDEPGKSRNRLEDEDMLAIEHENIIKNRTLAFNPYVSYKIKPKNIKINENFSLRILEQTSIYLRFKEGTKNLKLNLGMILDSREIIDVKQSALGDDILNPLDCFPAVSDSIADLQAHVLQVNARECARLHHKRTIRPHIVLSADKFEKFISRPLRTGC